MMTSLTIFMLLAGGGFAIAMLIWECTIAPAIRWECRHRLDRLVERIDDESWKRGQIEQPLIYARIMAALLKSRLTSATLWGLFRAQRQLNLSDLRAVASDASVPLNYWGMDPHGFTGRVHRELTTVMMMLVLANSIVWVVFFSVCMHNFRRAAAKMILLIINSPTRAAADESIDSIIPDRRVWHRPRRPRLISR